MKLGVDAAILFADILLPLEPMGAPFEFAKGEGPVIHEPIASRADVEKLRVIEPEEGLGYVLQAIKLLKKELQVPLIGFAGAPFTLASYLVEGGKSRDFLKTKKLMYGEPETWSMLMGKLSEVVRRYLHKQIDAGSSSSTRGSASSGRTTTGITSFRTSPTSSRTWRSAACRSSTSVSVRSRSCRRCATREAR
jgi:uroporphyrinogen decarboxylase